MKVYTIKKYTKEESAVWNTFVKDSKNGTFLFHRDFMEYHEDRFQDYSLMIYENYSLVALLPANINDSVIHSHQGLTYGGLILKKSIGGEKLQSLTTALIRFLQSNSIDTLFIKLPPVFYHKLPSNELAFFLTESGAEMYRRDLNLGIDYSLPIKIHKNKMKHFERNKDLGFIIEEVNDFSGFWNNVLSPRLKEKHGVTPVHTIEEISLLKKRFPDNIKQFVVSLNNEVLAGITIFDTGFVAKSQYGAVTKAGEKYRALDFLFITLIQKYEKKGYKFFDMGTVTESNFGLLKQKEELGCEIYTQDFYKLNIV